MSHSRQHRSFLIRSSQPISWLVLKKLNLTQQKQTFTRDTKILLHKITTNDSSAVAEMGDRGHNKHGPKRGGGCCAPFSGGAGSQSNTMWPRPRFTSVKWRVHPSSCLATIDMNRKLGALTLLGGSCDPI